MLRFGCSVLFHSALRRLGRCPRSGWFANNAVFRPGRRARLRCPSLGPLPLVLNHLRNRPGLESVSAGALNIGQTRARVGDNIMPRPVNRARLPGETMNDVRPRQDGSIIHDEVSPADGTVKMVNVHKTEFPIGRRAFVRSARRPTDVIVTVTPCHPCGGPFRARNPRPAGCWIIHPRAIMVAFRRPRLIALPIPPRVGPNPCAILVRPPVRGDTRRMPAFPIGREIDPCSQSIELGMEVGDRVQIQPGGKRNRDARLGHRCQSQTGRRRSTPNPIAQFHAQISDFAHARARGSFS